MPRELPRSIKPLPTFENAIYRRRKALSFTQEELADKVGVKPTYIGYLERGKRHPSPRIIAKLAEYLNLSRAYLFVLANPHVRDFLKIDDDTYEVTERPLPQALIELRDDRALRGVHGITNDEIESLTRTTFLGAPQSKMDYVFLIQVFRKVFGNELQQGVQTQVGGATLPFSHTQRRRA